VSISPTFYEQLFVWNCFCCFSLITARFCHFLSKEQLLPQYSCAWKLQSQTVIREKLCKILAYKKALRKMLMKLTPVWDRLYIPAEWIWVRVRLRGRWSTPRRWPSSTCRWPEKPSKYINKIIKTVLIPFRKNSVHSKWCHNQRGLFYPLWFWHLENIKKAHSFRVNLIKLLGA